MTDSRNKIDDENDSSLGVSKKRQLEMSYWSLLIAASIF